MYIPGIIYLERRAGSIYRAQVTDIYLSSRESLLPPFNQPMYDIEYRSQWDGKLHTIHTDGNHLVFEFRKIKPSDLQS